MTTGTTPVVATGIDCICYCAKDFARAKNFYQNVLGLKPSSMGGETWTEFDLDDGTTFALAQLPDGKFYPTGGAMFAVPDVQAAVEAARAAGATVYVDTMEGPACQSAWCEDSEGNNFAVHKRK